VIQRHVGIFLRHLSDGLAPEHAILEDVRLVDGGEAFIASLRGLESDMRDADDLALLVDHRVDGDRFAVLLVPAFRLAEVEAAGELAHAEHVEAAFDERFLHRRGVGQLWKADGRAQIGKEGEVLAQREQRGALGLLVGRKRFPFRAADRAEENRVGLAADTQGFLGKCAAIGVDGDTADAGLGEVELEAKFFSATARTRRASAMTSGPMPSPGRTAI